MQKRNLIYIYVSIETETGNFNERTDGSLLIFLLQHYLVYVSVMIKITIHWNMIILCVDDDKQMS